MSPVVVGRRPSSVSAETDVLRTAGGGVDRWPESTEVVVDLLSALKSSLQLLMKCEELVAMLRCSTNLEDTTSTILAFSHPRLKSAQQSVGTILSDVEKIQDSYIPLPTQLKTPALEPAVEIKIENENLGTGMTLDNEIIKEECNVDNIDIKDDKLDLNKIDSTYSPPPADICSDGESNLSDEKTKVPRKRRKKRISNGGSSGKKEKSKPYQCEHCDRILLSLYHLKKHVDATHTKFSCEDCDQVFDSRKDLKAHSRSTHKTKLKNFVCQVCGYTCHDLGPFNRHLIWHSDNRQYKCQHCGRAFHIKYHLDQHLRIHTGEKPYECEVCGKQFTRDSHLTRHRTTHSGEKNWSCTVCSKAFTLRENMKRHMKIHDNVKENQNP